MSATTLIVGAGQAGAHAAVAARRVGLAGTVLLCGDEATRPYERPFLSKAMLVDADEPQVPYVHPAGRYAELGIDLRLGARIEGLDLDQRRAWLAGGERIGFDRLVLATGGQPRRLSIPGAEHVLYLRSIGEGRALRARLRPGLRVVAIGAGVIGLEIAASASRRGCRVTVLEGGDRVMGRSLCPEGSAFVEGLHRRAGVDIRLGAHLSRIAEGEEGLVLHLGDGTVVAADLVVAGIGMERNVGLARGAGLAVDHGILVDECGRASRDGVYAAGDAAEFFHPPSKRHLTQESWKHAQNHGIHVGRQIAGQGEPYLDVPWFWTDQHDVNLQVAGFAGEAARTLVGRSGTHDRFEAVHLDLNGHVVGATSAGNPKLIRMVVRSIQSGKPLDWAP